MSKFKPVRGLDTLIAEKYGIPSIRRVVELLEDEAKRRAPEAKVWITMRDERVRKSHFETDHQIIPGNIKFLLPTPGGGSDEAMEPRDPTLPLDQRINCRCDSQVIPDILRDSIHKTDVEMVGNRVSGSVETRFRRAPESETAPDGHWMRDALQEVAARLRQS